VVQSVKCPTLDLSSGLDLGVVSLSSLLGSTCGAYFAGRLDQVVPPSYCSKVGFLNISTHSKLFL